MATESWIYIDGQKVPIPNTPLDARKFGWHLGTIYESALDCKNHDYKSIREWCRETFDPHVYKMFMRSVWFLREQDAVFCKLRWAK